MNGWIPMFGGNYPVISVLGRKDSCVRHPNYEINESEFISCMRQLNLDIAYLFFFDTFNGTTSKVGVFIEYSTDGKANDPEEFRAKISKDINQYLLNNNQRYALANPSSVNLNMPINVYFVHSGTFMDWTVFKANTTGIKSTNQVKIPRVAMNDETVKFFLNKVK